MYLKKSFSSQTGRTYLTIVQGYRDADGKAKSKTVKSIGFLDELEKEFDDPIAHFTAMAKDMDSERLESMSVSVSLDLTQLLDHSTAYRKNFGYVIYSRVFHELELDRFLDNARRNLPFLFNSEAIMRLLVFSRLLFPGSKRAAVLDKDIFFDKFDFTLDDVYHALTHFDSISKQLQRHLHQMVANQYGRDTELVYYDVTNYYFEIDMQDDLRRRGAEKNRRRDPIVQMGLLVDKMGLPITYRIFPGNTNDSQTMMPVLAEVKREYDIGRIIVVADKGLNCGDNIAFTAVLGDGYVFSKSIRGASADFQAWVLEDTGYRALSDKTRVKSKVVPDAEVRVTVRQVGKRKIKKTERLEQKWLAIYSEKYAIRVKRKRAEAVAKALDMISNPAKYRQAVDHGAAGYIRNLKVDKSTGEILNIDDTLLLDTDKIADEERFDGYYAIITSELDEADESILNMYHGLWRIEESFKVTKSTLEARPIFLQTKEHINAHFLICFISLLIARIVELRLKGKYSIAAITDTIRKIAATNIDQNVWLFDHADELTDDLNVAFDTNFGLKHMTLRDIKASIASSKRV